MNQEPIYKHLAVLRSEKLQYTKKRNTCPAPAAKRIYQPRNFQTLWCPEIMSRQAKQSPEIHYSRIPNYILFYLEGRTIMLTLYTAVGILRFQDSIKEHKTPTVINNRQEYGLTEEEFFLWSSLAFQIRQTMNCSLLFPELLEKTFTVRKISPLNLT